jgi:predicted negative regulator of RcsB-dependent stress response
MDPQMLFNLAAGLIIGGIGWFARQIWDAVQKLQADLHSLEVDLPKTYVSKTEYGEDFKEIKEICRQIFEKLSSLEQRKADR